MTKSDRFTKKALHPRGFFLPEDGALQRLWGAKLRMVDSETRAVGWMPSLGFGAVCHVKNHGLVATGHETQRWRRTPWRTTMVFSNSLYNSNSQRQVWGCPTQRKDNVQGYRHANCHDLTLMYYKYVSNYNSLIMSIKKILNQAWWCIQELLIPALRRQRNVNLSVSSRPVWSK